MLVGHLMMMTIYSQDMDENKSTFLSTLAGDETVWHWGWSFYIGWFAFVLCVLAGIIDFLVYRNFRRITEEMHNTPSRVKYVQKPTPVHLGQTI